MPENNTAAPPAPAPVAEDAEDAEDEMLTKDLIGPALDWAVAKCEGDEFVAEPGVNGIGMEYEATRYSTNWAQGGPIIGRENISVGYQGHLGVPLDSLWYATNRVDACGFGPTPLIAAMRCYCSFKLGNEVKMLRRFRQIDAKTRVKQALEILNGETE